jgi:Trypsin-like peptidase domain
VTKHFLRSIRIVSTGLVVALISLAATHRAIPDDNLAYPVLITLGNGATGSGFYLNTGKGMYLVTAKHVLFDTVNQKLLDVTVELLSYSKNPSDSTHNVAILDLSALQHDGNIVSHPSEDVAVVKIGTVADTVTNVLHLLPGVVLRETAKDGLLSVALENVKPFDEVLTGNDVMVFGYPTSLGLQQLPQLDKRRPLLRKGIVAGTNPEKRSIILDCPSYFGNSGGPVVELDRDGFQTRLFIIGVIREYVPFADTGRSFMMLSNSGYSVVTSMNYVLDLVK